MFKSFIPSQGGIYFAVQPNKKTNYPLLVGDATDPLYHHAPVAVTKQGLAPLQICPTLRQPFSQ